jgi:hypothetical protein
MSNENKFVIFGFHPESDGIWVITEDDFNISEKEKPVWFDSKEEAENEMDELTMIDSGLGHYEVVDHNRFQELIKDPLFKQKLEE